MKIVHFQEFKMMISRMNIKNTCGRILKPSSTSHESIKQRAKMHRNLPQLFANLLRCLLSFVSKLCSSMFMWIESFLFSLQLGFKAIVILNDVYIEWKFDVLFIASFSDWIWEMKCHKFQFPDWVFFFMIFEYFNKSHQQWHEEQTQRKVSQVNNITMKNNAEDEISFELTFYDCFHLEFEVDCVHRSCLWGYRKLMGQVLMERRSSRESNKVTVFSLPCNSQSSFSIQKKGRCSSYDE
jgi:hypothetical protein